MDAITQSMLGMFLRCPHQFERRCLLGEIIPPGIAARRGSATHKAAQSRAIRNVVCAGVPRWLLDQAMGVAKDAVANKITPEKLAEASEKAVKFFAGYGVKEEKMVAVLGGPPCNGAPKKSSP
jgi:hypothetical protein